MRKRTTGISIDEATLAELDAEAKSLRRSRSNLILSIIQDWLKRRKAQPPGFQLDEKPARPTMEQPKLEQKDPVIGEIRYTSDITHDDDDLF